MAYTFFEHTFKNLQIPVVVCLDTDRYPIVFANPSVKMLSNPLMSSENLKDSATVNYVADVLRFSNADMTESFFSSLRTLGSINNFNATILDYEDNAIPVTMSANIVEVQDNTYYIIYVYEKSNLGDYSITDTNSALFTAFHLAFHTEDAEEAIGKILSFVGAYANVSRVYIFEEESAVYTRNTYEWCADGVEPAIQDLQHLRKDEYNYDVIVNSGMYITDDIRDLPENDRIILEAQGIKSLAILPLFYGDRPLGYIGFDDCENCRQWSSSEVRLLNDISSIIVSLLLRRNSEAQAGRSVDIMQTISDNIDSIIYVSDLDTDEVIFGNKALTDSLGLDPDNLIGRPCWQMFQRGGTGRCAHCPIPKMIDADGKIIQSSYSWENQNSITGKWYLVRDGIIEWIDGRYVHIETATEITHQKAYEEKLKHYASVDSMTGAYNREWGYKIMQEMRTMAAAQEGEEVSLVFIDLDGLKQVNDTYGHDAGDTKIIRTISTIRSSVRQSDLLVRWGGDEFLLLLQCGVDSARNVMENIDQKLLQASEQSDLPFPFSISYGITSLTDDLESNVDAIISSADKSMYESKMRKRA